MNLEMDMMQKVRLKCGVELVKDQKRAQADLRTAIGMLVIELSENPSADKIARTSCSTMLTVADILISQKCARPEAIHFTSASKALLSEGLSEMAQGLLSNTEENIVLGGVMLEIIIRGMQACLNQPYHDLLESLNNEIFNDQATGA
jgi:hypothetical protein